MNGACESSTPALCGCCAGIGRETPQPITNRPGLSAIVYRVGTYGSFRASLLAALSDSSLPALAPFRNRAEPDFTLALLDAFAISLEVLTFYQERIANESYLRTAIDTSSVMGLAQLVGYQPSSGVAASTFLSMTLSSAAGSPDNVLIPAATRVQSIPGPGQQPQVFETSSDIIALIASNAIPAQTNEPWTLPAGATSTWIAGTANNLNPGDALLFIGLTGGVPSASGPGSFAYVTSAITDAASGNTLLSWDQPLSAALPAKSNAIAIYVLRKKGALFGVQAPNPALLPSALTKDKTYDGDWWFGYAGSGVINLDAVYPGLSPAAGSPQWLVLTNAKYTSYLQITKTSESNPNLYSLSSKTTQLTLSNVCVLSGNAALTVDQVLNDFTAETRSTTAYMQSDLLTGATLPITGWSGTRYCSLSAGMVTPVSGSSLSIVGGVSIGENQPLGISGRRVRLQVLPSANATFTPAASSNTLKAADNQVFLVDAYPPVASPVAGQLAWSVLTVANVAGTLSVAADHAQLLPSAKADPIGGEAATVSTPIVAGDIVKLGLSTALSRIYDANTVIVNANTVAATNGETMTEILGSGDASNPALALPLKQSPLTYISTPRGTGAASTLQVWVNKLRWQEVPTLVTAAPSDRVFSTSANAKQVVTVRFGDGVEGARPPTGQANLVAIYRKGIGSAGNLNSGQISQALDRPQGLKSVVNPGSSTGGADPDTAEDARASAPLHVLTLDRVVSLDDYQNFALAFAGIGKALATWTWNGRTRGIFLTVAADGGTPFASDDQTLSNLKSALWNAGNPNIPLNVASFQQVYFEVGANVRIDQTIYDPATVLAQAWQTLVATFSFDDRALGQGVAQSEVIALIQQTPGVIAVEVTRFSYSVLNNIATVLRASSPATGQDGTPQPAQLLVIDPALKSNLEVWK